MKRVGQLTLPMEPRASFTGSRTGSGEYATKPRIETATSKRVCLRSKMVSHWLTVKRSYAERQDRGTLTLLEVLSAKLHFRRMPCLDFSPSLETIFSLL